MQLFFRLSWFLCGPRLKLVTNTTKHSNIQARISFNHESQASFGGQVRQVRHIYPAIRLVLAPGMQHKSAKCASDVSKTQT